MRALKPLSAELPVLVMVTLYLVCDVSSCANNALTCTLPPPVLDDDELELLDELELELDELLLLLELLELDELLELELELELEELEELLELLELLPVLVKKIEAALWVALSLTPAFGLCEKSTVSLPPQLAMGVPPIFRCSHAFPAWFHPN